MATNNTPIVSIFDERGSAERAIEDLYNAGIPSDQISYSGGSTPTSGGGFLGSIKSLFTGGHDRTSDDVLNDLNNMGIPQDEAAYYAQQYDAGRTIVAIQQETPNQNALTILRSNGGYDYQGNWNKASADKFADAPASTTSSDNTYGSQNSNPQTTSSNDQRDTYNNQISDANTAPDKNFAGTEAGTYDQSPTTPAFTSQRRYAENTDTSNSTNQDLANSGSPYPQNSLNSANTYNQDATTPHNSQPQDYSGAADIANAPTLINQQTYPDPNQQTFNNAGQQSYADPNQQTFNNPNNASQQSYVDPNQQGFNNASQQSYVDPNQQGFNNPNNASQQTYPDPNQQGFNNAGQQSYANPNQQGFNNPGQQAYTDPATYNQNVNNPNQQSYNNPNPASPQTYTDSTQSANAYNQGINAPQNQLRNSPDQRIRTERDEVNNNPDQTYEREQRNNTDQNNI